MPARTAGERPTLEPSTASMIAFMGHASGLVLGIALFVGPAILVSCSPAPPPPALADGLKDGSGGGEDVEEAGSGSPPPSCAAVGGRCVKTAGPCPIQITGTGLCPGTGDEICCTDYADK
jgi:hypothetical protein